VTAPTKYTRPGRTPKVRAIASIRRFCGLVACPLRSSQMVVWETGSPVIFRIRAATSVLVEGLRPAGCAVE
jgi:hypothetical protein